MSTTTIEMPAWEKTFREGFAPVMSTPALLALRVALVENDPDLKQGETTTPPPIATIMDMPCEGACAIGFAGWVGDGLETVGQVEEYFARLCYECDQRLGETAGCRWFLNHFDENPREVVFPELLRVVDEVLAEREAAAHAT